MKVTKRNRQRNYKRNGDILFSTTSSVQRNGTETIYDIVDGGEFKLNESSLYFIFQEDSTYYYGNDRIRPYTFIQMYVDNEMNLFGYYPNIVDSEIFIIDNNGNLIWQQ